MDISEPQMGEIVHQRSRANMEPYEVFIVETPLIASAEAMRLKPKMEVHPFIIFAETLKEAKGLAELKVPNHLAEAGNYRVYIRKWQNET